MDFKIENFMPAANIDAIKRAGLHRIMGVMLGVPDGELTAKEAAAVIGARSYFRRKEARLTVDGIRALAEVRGEKTANWEPLLQKAIAPAAIGAGVAALPELMSDAPMDTHRLLKNMAMGGAVGGVGGVGLTLNKLFKTNPQLAGALGQQVSAL